MCSSDLIDQASELILDLADLPASAGDGKALMPTIARVEEHVGVTIERILGDGAYGSGENCAACAERPDGPVDLVSPMRRPADPEVDKSAFEIDTEGQTATCPQVQTVSASSSKTDDEGRTTHKFIFDRTSAWPVRCSNAVSAVKPPDVPSPPPPTKPTCVLPASASKPTSSKIATACAPAWKASSPNWLHTAYVTPAIWANPSAACNAYPWAQPSTSNVSSRWPKPKG